jgi:hypothetical protein
MRQQLYLSMPLATTWAQISSELFRYYFFLNLLNGITLIHLQLLVKSALLTLKTKHCFRLVPLPISKQHKYNF